MNNYTIVIDTNNAKTQVTLLNDIEIVGFISDSAINEQSKNLFTLIDSLFLKYKISYKNIKEIFVTIGPGSFTGIRVGIAAVNGIKIGTKINVFGFTNFQILGFLALEQFKIDKDFVVIVNAFRGQLYMQHFTSGLQEIKEPQIIDINDLSGVKLPIICDNSLLPILNDNLICKLVTNDLLSSALFIKFREFLILNEITKPVKPLYIRLPDAKPQNITSLH